MKEPARTSPGGSGPAPAGLLPRTPGGRTQHPRAPARLALKSLELHKQIRGSRGWLGPGQHVELDDRVQEVGLVLDADGLRSVQARNANQASAGQRRE